MAMAKEPRRGVIEGSAAVLRELLRTPRIRRSFDVILRDLDPENAPKLIDTIMEDPSIPFDLVTSTPTLINAGTRAITALLVKLTAYPPQLLRAFVVRIIRELHAENAGILAGTALGLSLRVREGKDVGQAVHDFGSGFSRGFTKALDSFGLDPSTIVSLGLDGAEVLVKKLGSESVDSTSDTAKQVQALAEGIARISRENPDFIERVVCPLIDASRAALDIDGDKGEKGAQDAR